eukprot:tig00000492_g1467.t1
MPAEAPEESVLALFKPMGRPLTPARCAELLDLTDDDVPACEKLLKRMEDKKVLCSHTMEGAGKPSAGAERQWKFFWRAHESEGSNAAHPRRSSGNHLDRPISNALAEKIRRQRASLSQPRASLEGGDKRPRLSTEGGRPSASSAAAPRASRTSDALLTEEQRLQRALMERRERLARHRASRAEPPSKREVEAVEAAIERWVEVCQEAARQLLERARGQHEGASMPALLAHLDVPPELLRYNEADDCFE